MRNNKNHLIYSRMNENSYDFLHSNISNISKNIQENLFQGMGTRAGLAAKELGFRMLQKAHEFNRARHFSDLIHAQRIDNQIIHSQIQKEFGISPKQIQAINYFGSPAEKATLANWKSSLMAQNPNLARMAKSSKKFTNKLSTKIVKADQRLNSPVPLSALKNVPSSASVKDRIKAVLSVNPAQAAQSLNRLREIQRRQRKNQLISQGANRFRVGLETSLI